MIKPFPIPVRVESLPEDDAPDYLALPHAMDTFRAPITPEKNTIDVPWIKDQLQHIAHAVQQIQNGARSCVIDLSDKETDRIISLNRLLGEGEVSARIEQGVHIQETAYVGIWRIIGEHCNYLEVADIPAVLIQTANEDFCTPYQGIAMPQNAIGVPQILEEISFNSKQPLDTNHIINLSLLPLAPDAIGLIDNQLGTGRISILSRGYGNCRITNTHTANTWRVVYYNANDIVILNSIEIGSLPDVACAAPEDFDDTAERLKTLIDWLESDHD